MSLPHLSHTSNTNKRCSGWLPIQSMEGEWISIVGSEDVLVPMTGDRGESEYDVTTTLGQKHIYSID